MGKKAKKKGRPPSATKRVNSQTKKDAPHPENANVEAVAVRNGTVNCTHIEKGFDLNAVSAKIGSSDPVDCKDCRDDSVDKKGGRGKAKHGKKKGGSPTSIWVCLHCGHYSCGGVGFPTNAQCHATKHARDTRHPMVIQFEKPNLRWCFRCRAPIPMEKGQESQQNEDVFGEVVKLIRQRLVQSPDASADVEGVWFGSGGVMSEVKSCNYEVTSAKNGGGGLVVRGLINLGNTCFFNSVVQNLLAIDRLRDYLSKLSTSTGPLTASLNKLFSEVHAESGMRNVVNPKGLFGYLCVKAPQFKGYQQHDSHELLRCLLDGLSTEEFDLRKRVNSDKGCQSSPSQNSTFIDDIFGGQISSTVCCVECGHSSTVYEPFLDLSLPVPTKKPRPKKSAPVSRAKKGKAIPKRGGKVRARISRESEQLAASAEAEATSGDSRPQNSVSSTGVDESSLLSQDSSCAIKKDESVHGMGTATEQVAASIDDNTWLDYLDAETLQDDGGFASSDNHSFVVHTETIDHLSKEGDSGFQDLSTSEPNNGDIVEHEVASLDNSTWLDYIAKPDIGGIVEQEVAPLDNSTWLDYLGDEPMEDEIRYSSRENDVGFVQNYWLNGDGFVQDTSKDEDQVSRNSWEDEPPLPVIGSEVLLLPYKDEIPATGPIMREEGEASSTGCRQDEPEFDGFGDLFEEPDVVYGPVQNPNSNYRKSCNNDNADSTFIGDNSSGSDAGEVDNSDSPVSVESCLAHFTRQELLSNDNAWHCEKCSEKLRRETKRKKLEEAKGRAIVYRNEETSYFANGDNTNNICSLSPHREDTIFQNGKIHPVFQNHKDLKDKDAQPDHPMFEGQRCSSETFVGNHHAGRASDGMIGHSGQIESELDGRSETNFADDGGETDSKNVTVKRDATKRVLIYKAPPVLTVHLKRFSQDARGRLSKLNGHVNFREVIDLTPYLDPRGKDCEKYIYRLVGVVEHLGVMRGGHYVAYVRGGSREKADNVSVWYYASDAHICEVTLEEVLRSDAYMLFYELV